MNEAEFAAVDRRLFERLHKGSHGPITLRLGDGRSVTGELVSIRRLGAAGAAVGAPDGEILLSGDSGETRLSYTQIEEIE